MIRCTCSRQRVILVVVCFYAAHIISGGDLCTCNCLTLLGFKTKYIRLGSARQSRLNDSILSLPVSLRSKKHKVSRQTVLRCQNKFTSRYGSACTYSILVRQGSGMFHTLPYLPDAARTNGRCCITLPDFWFGVAFAGDPPYLYTPPARTTRRTRCMIVCVPFRLSLAPHASIKQLHFQI